MIRPARVPTSATPVAESMLTKMMYRGSRNSTPGNIWVASTVVVNAPRPLNAQREIAYAARIATRTLKIVALSETTREFMKYWASGTVFQIAKNGSTVIRLGIHVNRPCTSLNGLSELVAIT